MLFFTSCEKLIFLADYFHQEIPECIKDEISQFEKEMNETCDEGAQVVKYKFQDQIVYAFEPSNCISDGGTEVLTRNCELLCTLGTIVGITECAGEEFENAEKLEIVWKQ